MAKLSRRLALTGMLLSPALRALASPAPLDLMTPWPARQPTPALSLPSWEGSEWTLSAQRGQVVLLNFWASWCEACRSELPALELIAHRHEAQGLQVVTVNFRETDASLRRFLDPMPVGLPILRDRDGAAARAWGVKLFPSTLVVGRKGQALGRISGELDWQSEGVRAWLTRLLA